MNEPIEAACAGNALVQGAARDPAQCVWCVERCHAYPYPVAVHARRLHTGHTGHRCSCGTVQPHCERVVIMCSCHSCKVHIQ